MPKAKLLSEIKLNDIVSIGGKEGLYWLVNASTNPIVESISDKKKLIINAQYQVSLLSEISVYDNTPEEKTPLKEVFMLLLAHNNHGVCEINLSSQSDLKSYFSKIFPEYDTEKVYPSNIKKIIKWYNLIVTHCPHVFEEETVEGKDAIETKETAEKKETAKKEDAINTKETEEKKNTVENKETEEKKIKEE